MITRAYSLTHPRDLGQGWAEFGVVLFNAVIEVDFEALLGKGEDVSNAAHETKG